ncbi:ribosomal-protein-alanine N-acetyltransferase [Tsuneonella dongtanensis]|uniref:Ribosomal-protein-alanine N-acetyltransferase n=1 Tax=Tsuneonella dongtanensis TaxID=692370 RepID=A0A1B2AE34_9SPHN|nr:GNAT family N-acetyltransferase [Tsuneonella dongtanensis]ANY20358.1 ribosomal-protein-alanine N-acetyltransferase [Tsuneonella dongtanensis]
MMDDLDRIMAVMEAAFDPLWGEAWTRRQVGDSLTFPHTHYRLLTRDAVEPRSDEQAAGFTLVRAAPGEEELLLVAVVPEARGRGLGHALITQAVADARTRRAERLFLEARHNNPAIALYRRMGFEAIGQRKDYYQTSDGQKLDAITFALRI